MDPQRQVTQQHYDLHTQQQQQKTTAQVLRERQEGPAAPLKKFHNEIKRRLIYRFCYQAPALIDYACGRGGDIHKWDAARIGFVKGLDISGAEINEAQRRFGELKDRRGQGLRLQAEFQQIDTLGTQRHEEPRQFNVATCMFALHYFFDDQKTLRNLMDTIAGNLTEGGYFIGCVPDGKRVKAHLGKGARLLEQPHLRLKAVSDPPYGAFGAKYIMEIPDTVVEGHEGFTEGSEEYMVFEKVLLTEAARVGLHPVLNYADAAVDSLFSPADVTAAMKHFAPKYPEGTDSSLATASEIYMAFVFQKVATADDAKAPAVPPPERKETGGFRAGGGAGGAGGRGPQRYGNDKMSSLTWTLPYAANYLPPNNMPVVFHNIKPAALQQRSELGRWIIWPPPMPVFPGPVQYTEDGREQLQRLPNGFPIHHYGQELDYWRQQQEQQQQQHSMFVPPPQPPPQQQQQHHCGNGTPGQRPNGIQQQQQQLPGPPEGQPAGEPPGAAAAAIAGRGGGRGARGGRGGSRKAPGAAGDGIDGPASAGRGRSRGRGSRGGRTAGSKRDRPAEDDAANHAGGGTDAAAGDDGDEQPGKRQAVEAAAAAGGLDDVAAAMHAAGLSHDEDHAAAADEMPMSSAARGAVAAGGGGGSATNRVPQSADAKLAKVIAADIMAYKERQEPAPLSPDFLAAMMQQAPQYADS